MRVHWKRPTEDVQIVRPDNEGDDYEIWVLTPVCIGSVQKAGTQRILANGIPFTNIWAAAHHLLEIAGHTLLAGTMQKSFRGTGSVVTIKGVDLVAKASWPKFCAKRNIDPRSIEAMQKTYQLTKQEVRELGIKGD